MIADGERVQAEHRLARFDLFEFDIPNGFAAQAIVIMLSIIASIVTNFWFTVVAGTGITQELAMPNSLTAVFEGFNLPAALLAITQNLLLGIPVLLLFLILDKIFVATTGDSMT